MENWLVLQNFYNGLTPMSRGHLDATSGGAFLSLTTTGATALIDKMVANQGWSDERNKTKQQKGMHTVKEMDMLAAKIDLLMNRLEEHAAKKEAMMNSMVQAMDSHMTYARSVEMLAIWGMTSLRPTKKQPSLTTGSTNKEVITGGTTSYARKEVIRTTIRINLP
jgi:hypothetical protein